MADADSITRICTSCKQTKSLTEFTFRSGGKFGRKAACKACFNLKQKAEYHKDPEKPRQRRRDQHALNKDVENAKQRESRARDVEHSRARYKKYAENRRELNLIYSRVRYDKYREREIAKARAWQKANPEKVFVSVRINNRVRKSRLRAAEGKMTAKQWREILAYHNHRCAYCLKPAGDVGTLEIDHMTPVIRNGTAWPENCVPACRSCNAQKHQLTPMEFLSRLCDRAAALSA